ncbi:hypothetical protein E1B28_013543 [Marasmius oreades]|uniref:Protein transport protein SFT2 n=1 Tax=Marasmius oreades TaxID=181124 RepID=A0A9P7UN44_9AGAR|nr:uncharacterized protein E1B28_013543 [Marasmius oreades]KAG7087590.1 hypothetical protein E1B28_013543 [Marasmius oreades]
MSGRMKRRLGLRCRDGRGSVHLGTCLERDLLSTLLPRLLGFGACLIGATVCFFVAFLTMLRPSKFALAFSLGSLLVMIGFSVLIGPINHLKHLVSKERLPFTFVYFGSLGLTLYFSLGLHSFFGSLIGAIVQVIALVAYVLAYFPGGTQTLRMGGSLALRGAGSLLPR